MLNKLLKHEFRATGRIMLPAFGAILALSVMAGISLRIIDSQASVYWVFKVVLILLQVAFFLSIFALGVVVVVLIVIRFWKSLMGDEGYVSFTLPVSADEHLWNKLLTSLVWLVGACLVCVVSVLLFFTVSGTGSFADAPDLTSFFRTCNKEFGVGNTIGFVLEAIAGIALACFTQCLHFYSAISIGGTFAKNKKLCAVAAYFILSILRNILTIAALPFITSRSFAGWLGTMPTFESVSEALPVVHVVFSGGCFTLAAFGAIYYFIARYCMTKKLNLA